MKNDELYAYIYIYIFDLENDEYFYMLNCKLIQNVHRKLSYNHT